MRYASCTHYQTLTRRLHVTCKAINILFEQIEMITKTWSVNPRPRLNRVLRGILFAKIIYTWKYQMKNIPVPVKNSYVTLKPKVKVKKKNWKKMEKTFFFNKDINFNMNSLCDVSNLYIVNMYYIIHVRA